MKLSWNMDESGTIQIFRMDNDAAKLSVADIWRCKNGHGNNSNAKEEQIKLANMICAIPDMIYALEEAKWFLPGENGRINHIVNGALSKAKGR